MAFSSSSVSFSQDLLGTAYARGMPHHPSLCALGMAVLYYEDIAERKKKKKLPISLKCAPTCNGFAYNIFTLQWYKISTNSVQTIL